MRNEPYDISDFGPLPLNERVWATVCAGEARRVYVFGGPLLTGRCLPNALGLEPVSMHAYRYDAEGALTEPDEYLRIATQLADSDGWLAFAWTPECAARFLRKAEAIIWLDDDRARLARATARHRQPNEELYWTVDRPVSRGVLAWPRRRVRGGRGAAHLLDIALEGQLPILTRRSRRWSCARSPRRSCESPTTVSSTHSTRSAPTADRRNQPSMR